MSPRKLIVLLLVVLLAVSVIAVPAVAQGDGGADNGGGDEAGEMGGGNDNEGGEAVEAEEEGEEGGIEGAISGFAEQYGLLGALAVLAAGVVLLTVCAEKLISYLVRSALGLGISLFALAILFTGFEFDDTAVALVFSAAELQSAALGTALGTGLAIVGITLALAAIVQPFSVDIPRDYLVVFVVSPLILIPFVLEGTLTTFDGIVLIALFVVLFGYIIVREYQRDQPVFRSSELGEALHTDGGETLRTDGGIALPKQVEPIPEDRLVGDRSNLIWVGFAILALVGIVIASLLLESGSEVFIEDIGIEGTVFGATVLTLILTFEDVMLTLEPVRRGYPEIGIGNVIGSVVFSMTANVGIILLLGSLEIAPAVATFHLPAVIIVTALGTYFLYQGRLKRWHGYLLGGLYVAYWVIALTMFGGVPIGG
jgi:cation:H+ antiporter